MVNDCTVSDFYDGKCTNWVYSYNNNGGNGALLPVGEDGNFLVDAPDENDAFAEEASEDPLGYPPFINQFTVYWAAVYWAIMTMSTIGYGDVTPQNDSERIYMVIGNPPLLLLFTERFTNRRLLALRLTLLDLSPSSSGMCLGAAIYAYLVGNVCSILAGMAAGKTAFREEVLEAVLNFVR